MDNILLPFAMLFEGEGGAEGTAGNDGGNGAPENGVTPPKATEENPEQRRKRYNDLINGEMKDFYTEDMNRIVQKRLTKPNAQLNAQKPILDLLAQRYGIADGNVEKISEALSADTSLWEDRAAEEGFPDVASYMKYVKMERELKSVREAQETEQQQMKAQQQVSEWLGQASEMAGAYPDFDLMREIDADPKFMSLLQAGIPVRHAYEVLHMDDIKAKVASNSATAAEKRITDNIAAKGARPAEAGSTAGTAVGVNSNVSAMTAEDRRKLAQRALRGERITFNN